MTMFLTDMYKHFKAFFGFASNKKHFIDLSQVVRNLFSELKQI